jgi:hypothetical protein
MGLRRPTKAREIKELMKGGMKASEIITQRPDLAEGFDDIVKSEAPRRSTPRGSGPIGDGPTSTREAVSMEQPTF